MVRDKYPDKSQVMAVGTTYSDIPMLNAADVGVFCTNFKDNPLLPWSDIRTSDMTFIPKLVLEQGIAFTHQVDLSIYYMFYKSMVLTMPLFFYNWYSSMTGQSIYDSVLLFLFDLLFTLLPIFSINFSQPFLRECINVFPAIYVENRAKKVEIVRKFIMRVLIEGLVHSVIIFYFCLYHICTAYDSKAIPSDFGILSLSIMITVVIVVNIKVRLYSTV